MTPELWNQLKPLFEAAVDKPMADRAAFIATIDADDEVRRELDRLLKAFESKGNTLDVVAADLQALVPAVCASLQPNVVLLDRFRIVRWLGSGGMGDVYEAFDMELRERVALKTVRPFIADNPDALARLKKEVQIARHLTAPNLCRIHELFIGTGDGCGHPFVFITMELLEGVTLAEQIRTAGTLSWSEAREIAKDICAALDSMHGVGIIHRDLKSRNIMLTKQNNVVRAVLMDFGLAREVASRGPEADTTLSLPGTVVGTPASMAPEQFSGGVLSPATDIYAMGVVLYEAVTGKTPFPARDTVGAAIQRGKRPVPVSRLRPGLPRALDGVIEKCLQFDSDRRYQSAKTLADDLQRVSKPFGMLWARISPAFRNWMLAAVVLILMAVGSVGWWIAHRAAAPPDARAVPWYEGGLAALREGSYLQAARQFEQALKLDGRFVAARARLAEAWAELDYTGAAEHELLVALQQAQSRVLAPLDRKYLDAIQASVTHDFDGAVRQQEEILQLLPEDQKSFGYVDLGRAQEKNNDIAGALKSYQTAANLRTDNPAAFVHMGILRSRQQDAGGAEAAFAQAEDLYRLKQNIEGLAEVYFARAHWANERDDSGQAELWLNNCMQIAREIPNVQLEIRTLTQLSNVEYESDRDDQSIEHAERAIQLARENHLDYWVADAMLREANALLDKRDFGRAQSLTQQALNLAEEHQFGRLAANAQFTLASIRDQQGKREEQIQYANAALVFYSKSGLRSQAVSTEDLLVRAQVALGNLQEAFQSATRLLEDSKKLNSPSSLEGAEMTMGNVLMKMQHYPQALVHFRQALQLSDITHQNAPYQLLHCADALQGIGNYKEAESMLNAITAKGPASTHISAGMARVRASMRLSQRRFQEAASIASRALKEFKDLAPDDLMDFGYVLTIANVELARRLDAQRESQKLADLAGKENNLDFLAKSNFLSATVEVRWGSPARAREKADFAQAFFSARQQLESEWKNLACLAHAEFALGDRAMAAKNARSALDTLHRLIQTWDTESAQYYASRPDTHFAAAEMESMVASASGT
jgi:tetratricopeptide (TPR) repeat protein